MPEAIPQTQMIQSVVNARKVGWWGQEIDFIDWLCARRSTGHGPEVAELVGFIRAIELSIEERSAKYVLGWRQAAQLFSTYRESLNLSTRL